MTYDQMHQICLMAALEVQLVTLKAEFDERNSYSMNQHMILESRVVCQKIEAVSNKIRELTKF